MGEAEEMNVVAGKGARREFAVVVALAVVGVALVSLVAFTPWYDPSGQDVGGALTGQAASFLKFLLP